MRRYVFSFLLFLIAPIILLSQLPSGFVAKYPLDNSANDFSGNGNNGSLTSTSATANRFGTSGAATQFTASSSVGSLPLSVQNNFTLGFWFKTSISANSGSQWYNGNSLVDAEVCGGTNDWGTALINGNNVCMGIGNPDITIISSGTNYADNNWHFVTATRSTSGTIILYIDGVQKASSSGTNTGALNAPGSIRLASNVCVPSGVYTGSLDDIIIYNRVLSSTEVTNLYNYMNAIALPLNWISFTGEITGNGIKLKWEIERPVNNDHFEIERSSDGEHFTVIGSLPDQNNASSYDFFDAAAGSGTHYYRIKQVDNDGKFSYSKTIKLIIHNSLPGIYLLANPVHNEVMLMNQGQLMIRQVVIMDVSEKIVMKKDVNSNPSSLNLNINNLKSGYYLIKVAGPGGKLFTAAFIKQ